MPAIKEVHFFDLNYENGLKWYKEFFRSKGLFGGTIAGEASPYYLFHPLVPQRVAHHLPKIKLIVLLRNPVDRAYSHFHHERMHKTEIIENFEKAIEKENERITENEEYLISGRIKQSDAHQSFSYISRGLYARQINRWLKHFPLSQMMFIKSEDFFKNPENELHAVYRFLGIKEVFPGLLTPKNANFYPGLTLETRIKVSLLFDQDARELRKLIGEKFRWDLT